MLFHSSQSNQLPSLHDIFPYAGEIVLLLGILILLVHFTLLSTSAAFKNGELQGLRYSTLMSYSSRAAVYLLAIVQLFNFYNLVAFSKETTTQFFFSGALILNSEIVIFKIVLVFLAILILLVSETYFKNTKLGYFEYNILFLSSLLGCLVTLSSNDLMTLYISLEIQALAFYIMATLKKSPASSEAGLKYFIVGSFSSALLLFGISLVVLLTGHYNFDSISLALELLPLATLSFASVGIIFGALLIISALLVKLAVAPFHEWVADIYEGIMTPTALFFATIPKISNFFILVRLTQHVFISLEDVLKPYLILICLLSLVFGCLNAFKQQNMKRFLAFSSVNHFGFILLGLILGTKAGIEASFFYLSFYIILTFGFWTSLVLLTYVREGNLYQLTRITELGGLLKTNPAMTFSLFLMLLSTGGIPPLAGFNAKVGVFYALIAEAFNNSYGGLLPLVLFVALLSSILSVYYYLRVIKILTFRSKTSLNTSPMLFHFTEDLSSAVGLYTIAFISAFNLFAFLLFLI